MAKRFYKEVSVVKGDGGYEIHLDSRTLKTPGKLSLIFPSKKNADLIAAEWARQDEEIIPASMPCTRLANVAIERGAETRDDLIKEARSYAATDFLCYRKNEPKAFADRQSQQWDPVLGWAAEQGVSLKTTDSLMAIPQDETALDAVAAYADSLDDLNLTLLVHFIAVFGSAVLGMATMQRHLTGAQAFKLSRLDELWQIEQWGEDEDATAASEALGVEVEALCQLIAP